MSSTRLIHKMATALEIKQELWRRGELSWLLRRHQEPVYSSIRTLLADTGTTENSHILNISRQFGKSFTMFLIACEECIRNPGWTLVYIAPLKSQALEIVTQDTFKTIFADAPQECIPKLVKNNQLLFQNGSRIRLAGTDKQNYGALRGGKAHIIFIDEAAFMSDLIAGVLPTVTPMLKTTRGKMLIASTPPENLDHDYIEIFRDHKEMDQVTTFTIYDDKFATEHDIQKAINTCKGEDTTAFKREYKCMFVSETSKQVVPELTEDAVTTALLSDEEYTQVINDPLYRFYKKYVVADWGGRDKTAIIFGHYNNRTSQFVVERHLDLVGSDVSSERIALAIKATRDSIWKDETYFPTRIAYWCDSNNVILTTDMIMQGLSFVPTSKGRLDGMTSALRDWFYDERMKFAPDAKFVLKSCEAGHWNNAREAFAKSKLYGHYDHLAAMVYLARNVDQSHDPIPLALGVSNRDHFVPPHLINQGSNSDNQKIKNIFNPRRNLSRR